MGAISIYAKEYYSQYFWFFFFLQVPKGLV